MSSPRRRALLIAAPVFLLVAMTSVYTIHETELGLVTRLGRPLERSANPGLHFKLPWPIEKTIRIDRRLLVFDNEPTEMLTRDKRNVLVDSFLLWKVAEPLRYAQTVGNRLEAEARLLDLAASELGAAVGRVPMENFINTDPEQVQIREVGTSAADSIRAIARDSYGIDVVDLKINGFNLPRQNRSSVIERMQAERSRIATQFRSAGEEQALGIEAEAEKARELLMAEARANAEVLRGQGEADELEILAKAYRENAAFYRFLRSLESSEKILDSDTTVFLPADSDLLEVLRER